MPTLNIECQIAQAQLKRYLTGEELPYALVKDLETHLKNCPGCMTVAKSRRESLKTVLASEITGRKIAPIRQPAKNDPASEALREATTSGAAVVQSPADVFNRPDSEFKTVAPKKTAKKNPINKTVVYSIALAAILVLMSTVFRDPTKIFGARAAVPSAKKQDTPKQAEPAPTATTEEPTVTATVEPAQEQPAETQIHETQAHEPEASATPKETVTPQQPTPTEKSLETDGFIVADSVAGTTVIKREPEPKPKPIQNKAAKPKASKPRNSTIKVYQPEK